MPLFCQGTHMGNRTSIFYFQGWRPQRDEKYHTLNSAGNFANARGDLGEIGEGEGEGGEDQGVGTTYDAHRTVFGSFPALVACVLLSMLLGSLGVLGQTALQGCRGGRCRAGRMRNLDRGSRV